MKVSWFIATDITGEDLTKETRTLLIELVNRRMPEVIVESQYLELIEKGYLEPTGRATSKTFTFYFQNESMNDTR